MNSESTSLFSLLFTPMNSPMTVLSRVGVVLRKYTIAFTWASYSYSGSGIILFLVRKAIPFFGLRLNLAAASFIRIFRALWVWSFSNSLCFGDPRSFFAELDTIVSGSRSWSAGNSLSLGSEQVTPLTLLVVYLYTTSCSSLLASSESIVMLKLRSI